MDRGVAFVGLSPDDERRLKAAIGIMSVSKQLPTPWRICPADEADLVIIAPGQPASDPWIQKAAGQGRPVVAAMIGVADSLPPHCQKLPWPVRATEVRTLLLSVEQNPALRVSEEGTTGSVPLPDSLLELARVLKEANEPDAQRCAWIIRGLPGRSPLHLAPRASAFLFDGPLTTLRNLSRHGSLEITRVGENELPDSTVRKPLVMLQWLVGILIGQRGLLPWIPANAAYSLKRWPDFTVLFHKPQHRRIAALLVNRNASVADIMRLTKVEQSAVNEFLNAASLTGRLLIVKTTQAPTAERSPNAGSDLFQRLRKALGIGVDS